MYVSVVFVPLLRGVEGLSTQSALEFLLLQDTLGYILSILKSSGNLLDGRPMPEMRQRFAEVQGQYPARDA